MTKLEEILIKLGFKLIETYDDQENKDVKYYKYELMVNENVGFVIELENNTKISRNFLSVNTSIQRVILNHLIQSLKEFEE